LPPHDAPERGNLHRRLGIEPDVAALCSWGASPHARTAYAAARNSRAAAM